MKCFKNLDDLLNSSSEAYNFYNLLSYDVQNMLNDASPSVCSENELIDFVINYIEND